MTALSKNTIILRRAFKFKSKNLFDQNEFKDFNSWSKKFSYSEKSNESEYIGIFY